MLRLVLGVLLSFYSLFALESLPSSTSPKNDKIIIKDLDQIPPTDEQYINDEGAYEFAQPNKIDLKISNIPSSVYAHEIFSMDVLADTKQNLSLDLNLSLNSYDLIWLNPNPSWDETQKGVYKTKLWLEANSTGANIEDITLVLNRNGSFFQQTSQIVKLPLVKNLDYDSKFANLVADKLDIKMFKSSKFDDFNNLIIFEFEVKNGNLNTLFIPGDFERQEMRSIKGDFSKQSGIYFIVARNDIKTINFNYYNLENSQFESFDFDIVVEVDELSTQVDLNPQESEFELYKDIVVYVLIIIFLLIFIWRLNYYALVFALLFGVYSFYDNKPFSEGLLSPKSQVQILPSKDSTIFYVNENQEKVKIMTIYKDYTKILLKNKKIGWAKNEDIQ